MALYETRKINLQASEPVTKPDGTFTVFWYRTLELLIQLIDLGKDVKGILPIVHGGTSASTKTLAFNNLSPLTTKGDLIAHDGTDNVRLPVGPDGYVLRANSAVADGVAWQPATSVGIPYMPLTLGDEPPTLVTDGAGRLIMLPFVP